MEKTFKKYFFGSREFDFRFSYVMGIVNITPDSFSDGGKYYSKENAFRLAEEMLNTGVDIIDIGGESTKPGSMPVSEDDELERVIPVIKNIKSNYPDAIISIDTTKYKVAIEALKCGAEIINDISGLTFDARIADAAAEYDAGLILMHIKGIPKDMQVNPSYKDIISEVKTSLSTSIKLAVMKGVKKIIIDPGIGFGKKYDDNYLLLANLNEFESLGFPMMIGVSRKSFIGNELNLGVDERDVPTSIIEALAIRSGVRIIRTHNYQYGIYVRNLSNKFIALD